MISPVVIDVASAKSTRLKMPPDPPLHPLRRRKLPRRRRLGRREWAADGIRSPSSPARAITRTSGCASPTPRPAMSATSSRAPRPPSSSPASARSTGTTCRNPTRFLWFSERNDWGRPLPLRPRHRQAQEPDHTRHRHRHPGSPRRRRKRASSTSSASARSRARDPYFSHFYSVHLRRLRQHLLTPENADHDITPLARRPLFRRHLFHRAAAQTAVLRDNDGKPCSTLARRTSPNSWPPAGCPRAHHRARLATAKHDLYGFMWKPTHMDRNANIRSSTMFIPALSRVLRLAASTLSRSLTTSRSPSSASSSSALTAWARRGAPRASMDAYDGTSATTRLPDQVAGIKDLARRYPFIDLDRVGIWGHSGGGFATADAMFHYPDFFKVGISESGNHDNRDYEDDWGENYGRASKPSEPDGTSNYDAQANQNSRQESEGPSAAGPRHLDDNVPDQSTPLRRRRADQGQQGLRPAPVSQRPSRLRRRRASYMMRRRWDYFVRYLREDIPPPPYQMKSYDEVHRIMTSGP